MAKRDPSRRRGPCLETSSVGEVVVTCRTCRRCRCWRFRLTQTNVERRDGHVVALDVILGKISLTQPPLYPTVAQEYNVLWLPHIIVRISKKGINLGTLGITLND